MDIQLTDEQRRVVEIDAGSHLVLAPPGSGKTVMLLCSFALYSRPVPMVSVAGAINREASRVLTLPLYS